MVVHSPDSGCVAGCFVEEGNDSFYYSWSMVTSMEKDLERGGMPGIHVQEDFCGQGDVQGYKEDARYVRSEKENSIVNVLAAFDYLQDEQTFLGAITVPRLSTWPRPKAKSRRLLTSLPGDFIIHRVGPSPRSTEDL